MATPEQLIHEPFCNKPHVVLLGAGASRAAFLDGDANGRKVPLMNDLIEILGLNDIIRNDQNPNFEECYISIDNNDDKIKIDNKVREYFNELKLPDTVTNYDRLLLSLRPKDAIFTFNWDPFLIDAYLRNKEKIKVMPEIFFLHGNVRIKTCNFNGCNGFGSMVIADRNCPDCKRSLLDIPLIYPIKDESYFKSNPYTEVAWGKVKQFLSNALFFSIFGYSAPKSDVEAIRLLKDAWYTSSKRELEHIEIIDVLNRSDLETRWKEFSPTYHFMPWNNFRDSYVFKYPRRSAEAIYIPMTRGEPCEQFPIPDVTSLEELQSYILEIQKFE